MSLQLPYGKYRLEAHDLGALLRKIDEFNHDAGLNHIYVSCADFTEGSVILRMNRVGWNYLARHSGGNIWFWFHFRGPDYDVNQSSLLDTSDYTDTDYIMMESTMRGGDKMSIVNAPPNIPKEHVSAEGSAFKVAAARRQKDVRTSMGNVADALILEGTLEGDKTTYSQLFSIDKDPIMGSVGRVLSAAGFTNREQLTDAGMKKLVGKAYVIRNRGGKLYWYSS